MLGINPEIAISHVRNAGGKVIRLIERKPVQSSCYCRTYDPQRHEQQYQPDKWFEAQSAGTF